MAEARTRIYSDSDIRLELRKMGHGNITPEQYEILIEDLYNRSLDNLHALHASSLSVGSSILSSSSSTSSAISITLDPEAEQRHRSRFQRRLSVTSPESVTSEEPCHNLNESQRNRKQVVNADSTETQVMKRKVFRYVNGKRVVMEELRPIPICKGKENNVRVTNLASSNPSRSSSIDDLSQRLSSVSVRPRSSTSSSRGSQSSLGVLIPNFNVKRKKCDPVSRYHEYRKYWDTFKQPGESRRSQLRWTVRERLLDCDMK